MKQSIFAIFLSLGLLSANAYSGNITIDPGSSITLTPNEETTVTCKSSSSAKPINFCRFERYGTGPQGWRVFLKIKLGGEWEELDRSPGYNPDCAGLKRQHPECTNYLSPIDPNGSISHQVCSWIK